jgi:hypothetical protein
MIAPLKKAERRLSRTLQNFRDQLSARTLRAFGVPLRTTEVDIEVEEPRAPDVHIGSVFDHSWELLSSITPMRLIKRVVQRHFAGKVPYMVEKNLSRLASQWEESIHRAMSQAGREAERQVDELMETIDRLIKSSPENAQQIRLDIERLVSARNEKAETSPREAVG